MLAAVPSSTTMANPEWDTPTCPKLDQFVDNQQPPGKDPNFWVLDIPPTVALDWAGIVSEDHGGIIAYVHPINADQICQLLNDHFKCTIPTTSRSKHAD